MNEESEVTLLTDAQVQWRAEDESVASIDKNGQLTALSEGVTEVTCEDEDGDSLQILITVKAAENVSARPSTRGGTYAHPEPTDAPEPTATPEPTAVPERPSAPEPTTALEPTAAPPKPEPTPDRPSDAQADTSVPG